MSSSEEKNTPLVLDNRRDDVEHCRIVKISSIIQWKSNPKQKQRKLI